MVRNFGPSRGFDTPLTIPLKNPRFLCRSRPRFPQLLKAALNVFVAEVQTLDDPEDLTGETFAQTGFYTHRGLDDRTSSDRPGVLTPDTPPRSRPESVDEPRGRHGKMRKYSTERLKVDLLFPWIRGSTLTYAALVKGPHESGAT
jgi:hypothetical protein